MTWLNRTLGVICILILAALLAVWAFSPMLTRTITNDALKTYSLSLSPDSTVRLNPFTSTLSISNLELRREQQNTLELEKFELNYRLLHLLRKQLTLPKITLTGLSLRAEIDKDKTVVAGLDLSQLEQESASIEENPQDQTLEDEAQFSLVSTVVELKDISIEVLHEGQPHELKIKKLLLSDSYYKGGEAKTTAQGELLLNGAKLSLKAQLESEEEESTVKLETQIRDLLLTSYQYLLPPEITSLSSRISLETEIELKQNSEGLFLSNTQATLNINEFDYADASMSAEFEHYSIELDDAELTLMDNKIASAQAQVKTQITKLIALTNDTQETIASIDSLDIANASIEKTSPQNGASLLVKLPAIELEGLTASHATEKNLAPLLELSNLKVNNLSIADNHANIDSIQIGDMKSFLLLAESGLDNLILPAPQEEQTPNQDEASNSEASQEDGDKEVLATTSDASQETKPTSDDTKFSFQISEISNTGDATIEIGDKSKTPAFKKRLILEEFLVTGVNSKNIEEKTKFNLLIKDEDYMRLALKGDVQPFKEHINANIESHLKEFSLPEVNGYLAEALGFEFKAGQLDTDISGEVIESKLDTSLKITIRGSDFSASQSPEDETNLIGQTAVPLNVALGMLKDKQGNINLTVPIRGDLEDPSFGAEYLLALVIKKAVMRQTKNYLMTTFVPYAQVVSVAMAAGSYALKVRFEDLEYRAGQTAPEEAQQTFVSQLSTLMADKPKLQVKICPVATPADINAKGELNEAQRESLMDIANQRAEQFKSAVVTNGVDSSRLLLCRAKIESSEKKSTRLTFSI